MENEEIKRGDVVRLNSSDVQMTVEGVETYTSGVKYAYCVWFNVLELRRADFNLTSLTKVS